MSYRKALKLCVAISDAGGTPYLTGGCVRDLILGRTIKDVDLEVFGIDRATLETILFEHCSKVDFVGAQYGIYKADGIDVGFPRRDKSHGKGAEVEVDPHMTVEEAAKRRDLTMNAMYLDPFGFQIIDPYNGRESIRRKTIVHVNEETFQEDPLRPVRAARFAATLGFDVSYATAKLCSKTDRDKIAGLPKDRVFGELKRVLLEAHKPSVFFNKLNQMYLLPDLFPELWETTFVEQGKAYHPEGSVYNHTMLAIDAVPVEERTVEIMLATLLHDLGKRLVPNVVEGDKIHFYGHAEETSLAQAALLRLTDEVGLTENVLKLIKNHMKPYEMKRDRITKKQVRRLASEVDMRKLLAVHRADRAGRGEISEAYKEDGIASADLILSIFEEIESEVKPILTGRHLIGAGMKPGNHFGPILKDLYKRQLEEEFTDVDGGLRLLGKLYP